MTDDPVIKTRQSQRQHQALQTQQQKQQRLFSSQSNNNHDQSISFCFLSFLLTVCLEATSRSGHQSLG